MELHRIGIADLLPDPLFASTPASALLVLVSNLPQWVAHGMRSANYESRKISRSNGPRA